MKFLSALPVFSQRPHRRKPMSPQATRRSSQSLYVRRRHCALRNQGIRLSDNAPQQQGRMTTRLPTGHTQRRLLSGRQAHLRQNLLRHRLPAAGAEHPLGIIQDLGLLHRQDTQHFWMYQTRRSRHPRPLSQPAVNAFGSLRWRQHQLLQLFLPSVLIVTMVAIVANLARHQCQFRNNLQWW